MRSPITWNRALRAVVVACILVIVVVFVAANFVLVEVRVLGLSFEVRLAWAVVVPAALAFAGGLLYARVRGVERAGRRSPGRTDEG